MKKIIFLALVILAYSSVSFAAALATNTLPGNAGLAIYGGTTAAEATNATNPLARMSTGVWGVVNFTAAANLSSSYAIFTKHTKGSKIFGTANDSTNVYWKASPAAAAAPYLAVGDCGTVDSNANFTAGWTAY
ncbi:MAG: hypothetical protein LWW87_08960 [Geobacteraceae bacterium]|nr:hypothetical protein [Geobacteraceae bacterium]